MQQFINDSTNQILYEAKLMHLNTSIEQQSLTSEDFSACVLLGA